MNRVVITSVEFPRSEPDRQYRVMVILQRADRPKFWSFHCMFCRMHITDLSNYDIKSVQDFYNPQDAHNHTISVKCPSCKKIYAFRLA